MFFFFFFNPEYGFSFPSLERLHYLRRQVENVKNCPLCFCIFFFREWFLIPTFKFPAQGFLCLQLTQSTVGKRAQLGTCDSRRLSSYGNMCSCVWEKLVSGFRDAINKAAGLSTKQQVWLTRRAGPPMNCLFFPLYLLPSLYSSLLFLLPSFPIFFPSFLPPSLPPFLPFKNKELEKKKGSGIPKVFTLCRFSVSISLLSGWAYHSKELCCMLICILKYKCS